MVLPEPSQFPTRNGYYQTALHECGPLDRPPGSHGPRHAQRRDLDEWFWVGGVRPRRIAGRSQRHDDRVERVGVGHDPQRGAAYVERVGQAVLEEDSHEIHRAARDAQKMSDYLMDRAIERGG